MQLLAEMAGEVLERGDIIRFPVGWHRHDDPSTPLDMMVREDSGYMALMYCSGYDAGFTTMIFPKESRSARFTDSLRVDWLLENWSDWFAYEAEEKKVIPLKGVTVLRRECYSIHPLA